MVTDFADEEELDFLGLDADLLLSALFSDSALMAAFRSSSFAFSDADCSFDAGSSFLELATSAAKRSLSAFIAALRSSSAFLESAAAWLAASSARCLDSASLLAAASLSACFCRSASALLLAAAADDAAFSISLASDSAAL